MTDNGLTEDAARTFNRKRTLVAFSHKHMEGVAFDLWDGSSDLAVFDCASFAEFLRLISLAIEQYIPDEDTKRCTIVGLDLIGDLDLSPNFWERIEKVSLELDPTSTDDHGVAYNHWQNGVYAISERYDKNELVRLIEEKLASQD